MRTLYFDNNATTRVAPEVFNEMTPYLVDYYGNPSSAHRFGGQVAAKVKEAREKTAALLGAGPEEVIFTSCGTESDNTAVLSALAAQPEKKHIVTSRVEHPAVRVLCQHLSKKGYEVTEVPVDRDGRLDMDFYRKSLRPDTAVVSLMWANNETGVIFPVEEAAEAAHREDILFHTDAVQVAGKIPINVSETAVDMLSISGHKLHAPKGVGALYLRRGTKFIPFLVGGHQEKNRRGGTENTPGIIALGKACEMALANMDRENTEVRRLRDRLENGLVSRIPNTRVNGGGAERLPNTTSISFEFIEGEAILLMLDELGICASSGSACTSGSLQPSHVLRAMGIPFTMAHGSIRFSLSIYNTEDEIDLVIEKTPAIIERLRSLSQFWEPGGRACGTGAQATTS